MEPYAGKWYSFCGRRDGMNFWICSAYRSMEKQIQLYDNKVKRLQGEGMSFTQAQLQAGKEVAYPGTSEHHLGLAVDIVAKDYQLLDEKQADTKEAKWLKENCWRYGFILICTWPAVACEDVKIILRNTDTLGKLSFGYILFFDNLI